MKMMESIIWLKKTLSSWSSSWFLMWQQRWQHYDHDHQSIIIIIIMISDVAAALAAQRRAVSSCRLLWKQISIQNQERWKWWWLWSWWWWITIIIGDADELVTRWTIWRWMWWKAWSRSMRKSETPFHGRPRHQVWTPLSQCHIQNRRHEIQNTRHKM